MSSTANHWSISLLEDALRVRALRILASQESAANVESCQMSLFEIRHLKIEDRIRCTVFHRPMPQIVAAVATHGSEASNSQKLWVALRVWSEGSEMANHSEFEFAISRGEDRATSNDAGQLDFAGQAILKLLHKAVGTAEANSRQALETAQKFSS